MKAEWQREKQAMPIPLKLALFGEKTGEKYADRLVMLEGPAQDELEVSVQSAQLVMRPLLQ